MAQVSVSAILKGTRFADRLSKAHAETLARQVVVAHYSAGAVICRRGATPDCWVGIVDGSVKIQVTSSDGRATTLATFSDGCWFGEGTLLKGEAWPFDAIALCDATMALIPISTFQWLLENSFPFNRFLIDQLNARLGQFISRCEHARLHPTDQHVAHCIAELVDPRLYPMPDRPYLRMSQEELGHLAGVSRTIVNRVLQDLERNGIVRVTYGAISLIDPDGLRRFSEAAN